MSTPDVSINTLYNVKGKIALVTGGSTGIGKMIASGFAQNGCKVYIASRKEDSLKEFRKAVAEIRQKATAPVEYIVANVASKAGCDALIAEFKKRESKLHILVNNSGVSWGGRYEDFPEEKGWDNVFAINVKSIFYMTAGLTDLLVKDSDSYDPGRVINISSTASIGPHSEHDLSAPGNGTWSYQPSKAAVNHLTSQLAVKLGPRHVTVNAILPGVFPSRMTAFGFKQVGEEKFNSHQPTGRFGTTQDMAGLALFLVSPASAHVTGAHIVIDGGARYESRAPASSSPKL
ncbi:hypothetical protein D9758_012962 [Tetrapyrgos nigripes]|uniref:NAD(P)-binding protein n=1 Tax=Tetrapyrgos nigripes TaxID=182062 RepID=A0A8H5CKP1_9AGAR|nr:hypothetical protein D9758_012962 [Tetrapyrgos nigripes]